MGKIKEKYAETIYRIKVRKAFRANQTRALIIAREELEKELKKREQKQ